MGKRYTKAVWAIIAVLIVALIVLSVASGLIQKWLWMRQVGYASIFWRILSIQWSLFGIVLAAVFSFFWINLYFVLKNSLRIRGYSNGETSFYTKSGVRVSMRLSKAGAVVASLFFGLIFALVFYAQWDAFLRFHWGESFGDSDPIFGKDIGFYLFRLPFYELMQNSLLGLAIVALLAVFIGYVYLEAFQPTRVTSSKKNWAVIGHLSVLFLFFMGSWGWGYYLDRFDLLYSTTGVVYGVGYTAYHATRIGLWVMLCASAALAALIGMTLATRRFGTMLAGIGSYFVLYFIVLVVWPGAVQKFKVAPNELELETPYLKNNIDFTRKAFQLNRIEEKTYPALGDLTLGAISKNPETINNIRLWDWRPILSTYRQTQEIRLYYEFYNVDVGRYHLDSGYHQVMLSARELAPKLPEKAQTWVNKYLQFTHGYGIVMNFVSKKAEGGFPEYIIKNIPPESPPDLEVEQPAVYYGEKMAGYRIVSTKVKEFDYPKGNQNVYVSYQGDGGIPLDNPWKRLLFAWTQSDINILLTSYLGPESRIQIWRNVKERVSAIAPFLLFDKDPYLVLSEGKLYWIQDAYTTSDGFPYSEPYGAAGQRLNYIRNSVKAVVDAYNGSVQFYAVDPHDPVLALYRRSFPGVFKDLQDLPDDLKKHLRYPEDLFAIQSDVYRTYHMTDPQVFYNREDLWTFPQEKYAGSAIRLEPYYILMRLPDTKELQYLIMTPFTPQNRDNMIAWMAAKCDFPDYGEVVVYQLPKEKLTLGPIQVEATIDQNTIISEQLSLWDQRGSRVIRGNLIVIPIENSFLYVEPVYLTAEGTNIPQLKRIIVTSGDKVVMEPTLEEALKAVFGEAQPRERKLAPTARPHALEQAREALENAQRAIEEGRWEEFGKAMESLKKILSPKP